MTVYAGVLNRHQAIPIKERRASVFKMNLILLLMATIIIAAYVFISNLLVAQKYALNLRKSEFSQSNAKLAEDRYGEGEDLRALFRFAQNYGLVEAKDIDYILEKDGFAVLP